MSSNKIDFPENIQDKLCLQCKGRLYCKRPFCPLLVKYKSLKTIKPKIDELSKGYYGPSPPSLFVGRYNYPNVNVGPLASIETDDSRDVAIMDEPDKWQTQFTMQDIVDFRSKLVRFVDKPINVRSVDKHLDIVQESVISTKPVDLEIDIEKIRLSISFDRFNQPMGPRAEIKKMQLASTPKAHPKIDKVVSDTDLNASLGIVDLNEASISVTQIMRVMSAGLLGVEKNRKLVPTRWSITSVDDIIGKELIKNIKDLRQLNDYLVFSNTYLDNHFVIFLMGNQNWSFDMHETWQYNSAWNKTSQKPIIISDYEGPQGRKTYAKNVTGGYYAARLAVLEKLVHEMKRRCSVIIFREIGSGYSIPLGVWQVRENVRKAMNKPYKKFESKESALKYIRSQLTVPFQYYVRNSPLLKIKRLDDFFKK